MTDQNNTTTVETSQTNSEATLEQWQHLPIYMTKDRVKPLAALRYGDTTVRLGWPIVDYLLSAQYSPTRHTEDGISPAVIVEETEMTYTAEPTAVPEPQREVWEILAKSPSYEMRKIAAGRGLKVETFIKLLNDRAFCVREAVLDNIDGLETLASTEDGRRAVADALKDRTLRNTVRHRIRYIDEYAAAVLRPLLIKAVTEGDAVAGDATPFELVLNPDTREVLLDGKALELTAREFALLHTFLSAPGRVFTREMLLARLWGYDFYGDERIVDSHIKNLRHKLGRDYIETVRGVGYRAAKETH